MMDLSAFSYIEISAKDCKNISSMFLHIFLINDELIFRYSRMTRANSKMIQIYCI